MPQSLAFLGEPQTVRINLCVGVASTSMARMLPAVIQEASSCTEAPSTLPPDCLTCRLAIDNLYCCTSAQNNLSGYVLM